MTAERTKKAPKGAFLVLRFSVCEQIPSQLQRCGERSYFFFLAATSSLSALPGRNLGMFAAAILISLPVCGFLPVRALRLETSNVPKPTSVTRSPFARAVLTEVMKAPTAFSAAAFVRFADLATLSTSSALVIWSPPLGNVSTTIDRNLRFARLYSQ